MLCDVRLHFRYTSGYPTKLHHLHHAPTCSPIFYMRKKVQKDLKDATDDLARFDINHEW